MKYFIGCILLAGAMAMSAQTPTATPAPTPVPTATGVEVTPTQFDALGVKMNGDVAVQADLSVLITIMDQYKTEEKALQDKLTPSWDAAQAKIKADIAAVKKANKWGDDVNFDPATKKWYRTPAKTAVTPTVTPTPVKK